MKGARKPWLPRCHYLCLRWCFCRSGRRVALDVAEAVAYLHGEARILHSDIKWVGEGWCNGPQGGAWQGKHAYGRISHSATAPNMR